LVRFLYSWRSRLDATADAMLWGRCVVCCDLSLESCMMEEFARCCKLMVDLQVRVDEVD